MIKNEKSYLNQFFYLPFHVSKCTGDIYGPIYVSEEIHLVQRLLPCVQFVRSRCDIGRFESVHEFRRIIFYRGCNIVPPMRIAKCATGNVSEHTASRVSSRTDNRQKNPEKLTSERR